MTSLHDYNLVMQPINFYTVLVDGFLSAEEARLLIKDAQKRGFTPASSTYPPRYRNNALLVVDAPEHAPWIYERLRAHLPQTWVDSDGATWKLAGYNSRFRYCRYHAGHEFVMHRDGAHFESSNRRSFLTVVVYLNGTDEFEGGSTRFFHTRHPEDGMKLEVRPSQGTVAVFEHSVWHDGARVTKGCKHIMRTDIMYERCTAVETHGHNGYVWALTALGGGMHASGGRDKTVRIWDGDTCVEVLRGHSLSVTAAGSNGEDRLWTGSRDGEMRTWSQTSSGWQGASTRQAHEGAIISMTDSCHGRFATGGADHSIGIWGLDGSLHTQIQRHEGWVWGLDWGPAGGLLSGAEDGVIASGTRQVGTGHPVRALACGTSHLVTGDDRGTLTVWDYELREQKSWAAHDEAITALVALSPSKIASASEDGSVRLWDVDTLRCLKVYQHEDFVRDLIPKGDAHLVSAGYDGLVRQLVL